MGGSCTFVASLRQRFQHCQAAAREVHGLHVFVLVEHLAQDLFECLRLHEQFAHVLLKHAHVLELPGACDDALADDILAQRKQGALQCLRERSLPARELLTRCLKHGLQGTELKA